MRVLADDIVPYGWLLCNGSVRSKTLYPELYEYLPNTLKNIANQTFTIDLRELELVGTGTSSRTDISYHESLSLGAFRNDQFQGHTHYYALYNHETGNDKSGGTYEYGYNQNDGKWTSSIGDVGYGSPRIGHTTHGKNMGVNYIIKALP